MIILSILDHFVQGTEKSTATLEFLCMLFIFALLGYLLRHVLDNSAAKLKSNEELMLDLKLEITQLKDKLNDQSINLDVMEKKWKAAKEDNEAQQQMAKNRINQQIQSESSIDQSADPSAAITQEEIAIAKEEELHADINLSKTTSLSLDKGIKEQKEMSNGPIDSSTNEDIVKKESVKKATKKDDLKVIEGIGPAIERWMNENGISSYEEMASYTGDELNAILEKAGPRFRVHDAGTWGEQAKLLAAGKIEEFNKYTSKLIAGKKVKK